MTQSYHNLGYNETLVWQNPGKKRFPIVQTLRSHRLPDFFIAGAQKAGTTSLYGWLVEHPDVVKSLTKEAFYFNDANNYKKGEKWYKNHFPDKIQSKLGGKIQLIGDASANYFESVEAPSRIINDLPDAKVVILLRNPVDRAYSHYQMAVKNGFELLSFKEALELEEERIKDGQTRLTQAGHNYAYQKLGYRSKGIYVDLIKAWREQIPTNQLLILHSEKMYGKPQETYDKVVSFLGLKPHTLSKSEVFNAQSYPAMEPNVREKLHAFYTPHNDALEFMLNRNFHWKL